MRQARGRFNGEFLPNPGLLACPCPRFPDPPVARATYRQQAPVQHRSRRGEAGSGAGESMGNARVLSGDGPAPQPLVRASGGPQGLRGSLGAALPLLLLDASAICLAWFLVAFLIAGRVLSLGSHIGAPTLVGSAAPGVLVRTHALGLYAWPRAAR